LGKEEEKEEDWRSLATEKIPFCLMGFS